MGAVEEGVSDGVVRLLLFQSPYKRDGFTIRTVTEEGGERGHDVCVFVDKRLRLYEHTGGVAEFGDVGGRDHPFDGIEVFVGEPRAVDINVESKEGAGGVPDLGFVGPKSPFLFKTKI